MPKISIILPTYNCAGYLSDSISSALAQTFRDFELLIIDDGSTDNTGDLIEKKYRDPRIRYIRQGHMGLAAARNTGLANARGEYVTFLDADDLFTKDKIEKQLAVFEKHSGAGVVYTGEKYFYGDDKNRLFDSPHAKFSGDILFFLKRSNFMPAPTIMIRVASIGETRYDPSLKSHEDWDFLLKLSAGGVMFRYLPEPLTLIRVRKTSMTAESVIMDRSRVIVGNRAKKIWEDLKSGINTGSPEGWRRLFRYLALRARAKLINFPDAARFNKPLPFNKIPAAGGPRLIFGTSIHENFGAFMDLSRGAQKFFQGSQYIYASHEGLGRPSGNLIRIRAARNYKWRRSHNFIFDSIEQLKDFDYDFFIALDSDCLICGSYLKDFVKEEDFDFVIYPNLNGLGWWYHGRVFKENIGLYLGILRDLGIRRKDEDIVGNFNPLIVLSKRSVDFLRGMIPGIESSPSYKELMKIDFSVGETLIFNILKDAGFKSKNIDSDLKRGLRFRPYWEAHEFKKGMPIYHPVRRKWSDPFRRRAGIEAGYDRNYLYMAAAYALKFIKDLRDSILPGKKKDPGEENPWFNP